MNGDRLRGIRAERRVTNEDCGNAIGLSALSYRRKESGEIDFKLGEVVGLVSYLHMNFTELNDVFFDGRLTVS